MELYFNQSGQTHSLRLRRVDDGPTFVVWEALVDSSSYTFFETGPETDCDVWDLFSEAIAAYTAERDSSGVDSRWRKEEK